MTIQPIFMKRSQLLNSLRLSESSESSVQQIDDAILETRTGFYRSLGSSRVAELAAVTHSDTPASDDELDRARAESVEVKWVKLGLMRSMPTFFMEATGSAQQTWNEEGLLRDADRRLEKEIDRLQSEVNCGLQELSKGECSPNVAVIGPTETNTYPGSSIFPTTITSG